MVAVSFTCLGDWSFGAFIWAYDDVRAVRTSWIRVLVFWFWFFGPGDPGSGSGIETLTRFNLRV